MSSDDVISQIRNMFNLRDYTVYIFPGLIWLFNMLLFVTYVSGYSFLATIERLVVIAQNLDGMSFVVMIFFIVISYLTGMIFSLTNRFFEWVFNIIMFLGKKISYNEIEAQYSNCLNLSGDEGICMSIKRCYDIHLLTKSMFVPMLTMTVLAWMKGFSGWYIAALACMTLMTFTRTLVKFIEVKNMSM